MLLSKVKTIPKGADKALDGNQGLAQMKKKLELCCKKPYRFIVVDLNMPHLDGVSMMQKLAEHQENGQLLEYKSSLFIIATCQAQESMDGNFKDYGFKYYLQKPIKEQDIKSIAKTEFEPISEVPSWREETE